MELVIVLIVGCLTGLASGSMLWFFPQQRKSLQEKNDEIAKMRDTLQEARNYQIQHQKKIQQLQLYRLSQLQRIYTELGEFDESQLEQLNQLDKSFKNLGFEEESNGGYSKKSKKSTDLRQ